MSIGSKIRELRKKRNISQEELGNLIDTHLTNVGRYERDIQMPSAEIIKKIAVVFEVAADELLFDEQREIPAVRVKDERVLEYLEVIDALPVEDREVIFAVVDSMAIKNEVGKISSKVKRGKGEAS